MFVTDIRTGIYSGAIYADVGRAVGEASLALALMISIDPFHNRLWPKVTGGVAEKRIFHLVFPQEVVAPPWSVDEIQKRALDLFRQWGAETALRELFPGMPAMSGPRPVIIKPPTEPVETRRGEETAAPQFRGQDVPKAELDR